ncbi:hypothetical protein GQ600_24159 [Phytophthora cactorum]|nr:hypothetical protein GQ600_24159 [Phytophthora cactorum]
MVADGYDVLLGHIKRVFDTTNGLTWEESVSVYVKPTNHAPQKDYIQHGHAAFVLMLYVYVSRPRAQRLTSLRRATDGRIQEQLPRVTAQARLPDDAPVQVPDNATMRQLRFIDEKSARWIMIKSNSNAVVMVSII